VQRPARAPVFDGYPQDGQPTTAHRGHRTSRKLPRRFVFGDSSSQETGQFLHVGQNFGYIGYEGTLSRRHAGLSCSGAGAMRELSGGRRSRSGSGSYFTISVFIIGFLMYCVWPSHPPAFVPEPSLRPAPRAGKSGPRGDPLVAEVQRKAPDIHLSTDYRNLEEFEKFGDVVHAHLGSGPATYHRASSASGHFVCEECARWRVLAPRRERTLCRPGLLLWPGRSLSPSTRLPHQSLRIVVLTVCDASWRGRCRA